MDNEEEYFHTIVEQLAKEYNYVKIGKMMPTPGISYKKKFFAFYYNKEITLRLDKNFVPKEHGIKKWKYLNPFKKKAPMKNWYQLPYYEKKNWKKLSIQAMNVLMKLKFSF